MSTDSKYLDRVVGKCFDLSAELLSAGLLEASIAMGRVTKIAEAEKNAQLKALDKRGAS